MNRPLLCSLLVLAALVPVACSDTQSAAVVSVDAGTDVPTAMDTPPPTDVPVTADVPADVPVDVPADTATRCAADTDCAGHAGATVCNTATGQCVACLPARDTCPGAQHCDPGSNACAAGCHSDDGCTTATADGGVSSPDGGVPALHCDPTAHACVQCVTTDQCPAGTLCMGNACVPGCSAAHACPTGLTCCAGGCVDTQTSTASCGACNAACMTPNGSAACTAGACGIALCTAPFADCNHAAADGCETDTRGDPLNCGACGMACATRPNATPTCAMGTCVYACNPGYGDCDGDPTNGCETDVRVTAAHCGACATACTVPNATAACAASACAVGACAPGYADCNGMAADGCETPTAMDPAHCGGCGTACAAPAHAGATCAMGTCGYACSAGYADCNGMAADGCEVATGTDPSNCGACAHECPAPHAVAGCGAGACTVASCETGWADCNGVAADGCEVNTLTSNTSCGACGTACTGGQVCLAGACGAGPSCASIHAAAPTAASGVYSIDPDGAGGAPAFPVYCDMTTDGGGWTLVMMAASTPAGTFGYNATAWTDTSTLNPTVTDPTMNVPVKSPAFNTLPVTALRFCLNTPTACLSEAVTATSARAVFLRAETLGSHAVADYAVWGYPGNLGCNRRGFNVYDIGGGPARCRYGILLNNEAACEGSVDGGRGFGCHGYYGTEVSAGQGDGIVTTTHQRGWVWAR